ncbi:MAG: nuclease family protein [Bradyrhizobium sp.]|nr:nuclease family protein [Bradyrhizobium sp.]
MKRRVTVVDGPLAFSMARYRAARANDVGLEILTLPLLAARLAGGFRRLADRETLADTVARALQDGGFAQLDDVRGLPGMVRAVLQTLDRAWAADIDLDNPAFPSARVADIAMLERRVRDALPHGAMLPRQLRDASLERVRFAPTLFGCVRLENLVDVEPLWRPLLVALAGQLDVSWSAAGEADRTWFPGRLLAAEPHPPPKVRGELCADPRAEVVESLRWVRELLSRGNVHASDVVITAASTPAWDEHMLVLAAEAGIPIHFSHGIPALSSWDGQSCAALADVLGNGLSQERVRRLMRHSSRRATAPLPDDWAAGLPPQAGLFTVDQWRRALHSTRDRRSDPGAAERLLIPMLELLAQGLPCAEKAGTTFLGDASLGLWKDALRNAPSAAVAMSLESLRIRDAYDPANSVVWCPASHLVGAPRPWRRLLGVAGRSWPRSENEDPLLPDHVISRRLLIPVPTAQRDRRSFEILFQGQAEEIVLSRSQRSTDGALQCNSALWPAAAAVRTNARTRIPEHAFSEADRLLARAAEAGRSDRIKATLACWRNWNRAEATPHDGMLRAGHPAVARALARLHSATSLKLMVRDPLGFLWRYAVGMRSIRLEQLPLALDALTFGELVHELLGRTIDALEPAPGFVRASRDEIEIALAGAVGHVAEQWPLERPVPPALLWKHSLDEAARRGLRGLTIDETFESDTTSWSEVGFGLPIAPQGARSPWPLKGEIVIGAEKLKLGGRIDRVDFAGGGRAIRISDYKTGATPRRPERIVVDRGRELQRVLYATAVGQLLPDASRIISRLVYLDGESRPFALNQEMLNAAAADVARFLDKACELLRQGNSCPGPDAKEPYNDLRLALPADLESYFKLKANAFGTLTRELDPLWSAP